MKTFIAALRSDTRTCWRDAIAMSRLPLTWQRKQWLILCCLSFLLAAAFAFDESVRMLIAALHGTVQDSIFNFGHWYGSGMPTLYLLMGCYAVGLIFDRHKIRIAGLLVAESYILSGLLTVTTKSLVGRWRPFTDHGAFTFTPLVAGPNDFLSFPSGHATVAFALSSVLAGMTRNRIAQFFLYLLAVITAVSRIYHDQHWLSDVVLSAIFGTSVGLFLTNRSDVQQGVEV